MNRAADDLISRVVACDEIGKMIHECREKGNHDLADALILSQRYVLKRLPTVNATSVVHGRWIKMTGMMPPEYHGHYECSECGWHMKGLRNSWTREEELNYCPNCGAKMEIENE